MDEYSEYNPQYGIEAVTFRLYSSSEIKSLSVKEIKNPETFDNLMQPTFGGLYDPALGPTDRDDACTTCGQNELHCPGHMGHIELPLVCYNPVFFKTLYKLLKSTCLNCHRVMVRPTKAHLFINQCRLLDQGHVPAVGQLLDVYSQCTQSEVDKQQLSQHIMETVTNFTENAIKDSSYTNILVKNVESARNDLVTMFMRDNVKRVGKCLHCQNRVRPIRHEREARIVLMGKLDVTDKTATDYTDTNVGAEIDVDSDDNDGQEGGQPKAKRQKIADSSVKTHAVTLLTAQKVKEHLHQVWEADGALLKRLYPSLVSTASDYPVDIFFLDTVPVPPSRFRPVSEMKGRRYENAQTANLARVLKNCVIVRELLWEIEKVSASTELPSDRVLSLAVSITKGRTLFEKLNTAWTTLQTSVNCVLDSKLDKLSKDVNPGIKQLLEKKEGLFRKNMMGKRVNYAARSVISPDPNINTNEIGIPEVFATVLTYPEPVTPWNVHELRQAVINGPKKHPGARYVVNEDGSKLMLDEKSAIQRQSIANQLLKPTTFHGKVLTGTKKVCRHLKNGDVLLINRQPTLHRPSIQAHKARVLPNEKTLRLHYANCKAYNADFDGDEMNAHFPQNEIARAEAYTIASTDHQYLVPKDGTPLAGLIQDHMVSGVTLTIRGRYFVRDDYCKLVYATLIDKSGPVKLLPPTILKPYRLWSGKQVLSTVVLNVIPNDKPPLSLTGTAKIPEKNWVKVRKRKTTTPTPAYMGESDVIIRQGELLCGVLDKGHYGPTPFGLVHSCYELYGGRVAGQLLTCFGRLFLNFLQIRGFTLGVEDILVTKKADRQRRKIVVKSPRCGEAVARKGLELDDTADTDTIMRTLKNAHFCGSDRQIRELDMAMRSQTNDIQNSIVNSCMPMGLQKLFPDNNLQLMVQSGAKGSTVNCMQISCLLGQIELEGKRPPLMLSGKTLPSFLPYDLTPRAGGFVTGRFLTGIRQQEYFFHCMAGREGLIDTAVKTSRSGYLQRCLIKHLEGIKVNYDLTVRDGDGSVIQFYYGEDSLDICKTSFLTPKQFPFLIDNQHILQADSTEQTEHQSKLHKLRKLIAKWRKKHSGDAGGKLQTSGFLMFCQSVGDNSPSFGAGDGEVKWPGRSREAVRMCQQWRGLSEKQQRKYNKKCGPCPAPVLSQFLPYNRGALPEKFDDLLTDFTRTKLTDPSCSISEERFIELMSVKMRQSIAEPGDAVGLLCAQSIGEPSTQMTLNTFHFAGRGEMNVTLGIPRLREILMVGSGNIKTPAMDIPVLPGDVAKIKAKKLQKRFTRVFLNEVLKDTQVCECLAIKGEARVHRRRVFRVRFDFLPPACYQERFTLSPTKILRFMETSYIQSLLRLIKGKIRTLTKTRFVSSGKQKTNYITPSRSEEADYTPQAEATPDSDDMDEDYDGDAAGVKNKQKHAEEHEYEDEEQEAEDGGVKVTDDEAESDKDLYGDVEMDEEEYGDLEETIIREVEARDGQGPKLTPQARRHKVCQIGSEIQEYKYDVKKQLWCEVTFTFPLADSKMDLLAVIEKDVRRAVIHEVPHIAHCFLGDQQGPQGTELHFTTEGINVHEVYKSAEILDLKRLYCNNIHYVADTFGIEAASKVIVKEIQAVFAAYGIDVDYRHLSLLADYMTFEGTYKSFNCMALRSNASPLQKMSFERTMEFVVNSSISEGMDDLTSPSAQIVVGKNVSCGTGSHTLRIPLTVA